LELAGDRIAQIGPGAAAAGAPPDAWIAPGLVDLQINGHGGQEFSSPQLTKQHVASIVEAVLCGGVTRLCPTVTTEGFAVLSHSVRTIAEACGESSDLARRIVGIHVEGPYISPEDGPRGAHPRQHCRPPDWDEFQRLQEAAGGMIRLLTVAAEYEQAPEFIRRAANSGVVVAIGHTAATPAQIAAAVDAGARLSTHLGNGSHPLLPRHPNYIWSQLADDRLSASLIADGHHLPAEVVKCFIRVKSVDRCVLVSDLSGMAGLPPGRYEGSLNALEILADGRLVVAGQRTIFAGAGAPLYVGVANAAHFAGIGLAAAIRMATLNPARLMGIASGEFSAGKPADFVLFDLLESPDGGPKRIAIRAVVADGKLRSGQL
jgi:N-acetylglucosamine-6-phosphate deacetylase